MRKNHARISAQLRYSKFVGEFFLGVDGGQSSTIAVIGDESGKIVGWGRAGPCNHVGAEEARARFLSVIRECLAQAAVSAGLEPVSSRWRFKSACMGMSGGPEDKTTLLDELIEAEHITVTHDAAIALAGATAGEPGIIVISGTGSMAFGQNARGETARAGGWGYIFGDEGGAFDIARQALRAVLREHEGWGGHTALTPALLETTRAQDANEMLHLFYTDSWPRQRIAHLARIVTRIAEEGDPIALRLLHQGAQELALLAGSVRRQLWREGESVTICWSGGVFGSAPLLERFRMLIALEPDAACEPPMHGPAEGALLLAWRSADLNMSSDA